MSQEQRKHTRVTPADGAPLKMHINGEGFIDILPVVDISMGGIGVMAKHRFHNNDINSTVNVSVRLPKPFSSSVHANAILRHVRGQHFGIEFRSMSEQDKRTLKRYISERLGESSVVAKMKFMVGLAS